MIWKNNSSMYLYAKLHIHIRTRLFISQHFLWAMSRTLPKENEGKQDSLRRWLPVLHLGMRRFPTVRNRSFLCAAVCKPAICSFKSNCFPVGETFSIWEIKHFWQVGVGGCGGVGGGMVKNNKMYNENWLHVSRPWSMKTLAFRRRKQPAPTGSASAKFARDGSPPFWCPSRRGIG